MVTRTMKKYALLCCCLSGLSATAWASGASDAEFAQFKTDGAANFSAEQGKKNWNRDGEKRACITCHGTDPKKSGQHATTQKVIEPMSSKVNPERYTDINKMDKWFKRNCEWAWSRECTAQEKGDILTYLTSTD